MSACLNFGHILLMCLLQVPTFSATLAAQISSNFVIHVFHSLSGIKQLKKSAKSYNLWQGMDELEETLRPWDTKPLHWILILKLLIEATDTSPLPEHPWVSCTGARAHAVTHRLYSTVYLTGYVSYIRLITHIHIVRHFHYSIYVNSITVAACEEVPVFNSIFKSL